jgi:hypothetical protein
MLLVQPYTLLTGSTADWIAGLSALSLLALALQYLRLAKGHDLTNYSPRLAWLRAGMYFSAAVIVSWSLGVLHSLLNSPLLRADELSNPWWLSYTAFYAVVLWVAYVLVWPKGTFTDGRSRHLILTTGYGVLWGLCHGQVFLCFWALAELTGLNSYWVAGITYALLSGYNFAFHQYFWDVQVSPPHNYEVWNLRKVLYCHAPNLLLGLVWLAIWGNFGLWLLLQTFCLLVSVHSMRFPVWYDDYTGVAGETR